MYLPRWQHLYGIERKRIAGTPEGDMRLHRLERPVPWDGVIWPVWDHIERYPDYQPFIERLAKFEGVEEKNIVVGAGIESLVRDLMMLCLDKDNGYVFLNSCAMFEVYGNVFNARWAKVYPRPEWTSDALLSEIKGHIAMMGARLMLLPNPGQPVETYLDAAHLRLLAEYCQMRHCVLAVDEAYYGFGSASAKQLALHELDNMVILRTFSKAFGAAGSRVGYAIGQETAIMPLNAIRLSGEISGSALHAATKLMVYWPEFVEPGIRDVCRGRDWLREKFEKDYGVTGSLANHVLVDMRAPEAAQEMAKRLAKRRVHVRCNAPPLDPYIMITCGPLDMMKQFWDIWQECVNEPVFT